MDSAHRKYGGWNSRKGLATAVLSARQGPGLAQGTAAQIAPCYISILLLVFQHCRSTIGDGVDAAQEFGDRFNLSLKSVTDTTFLTADGVLLGHSFGDWVDFGNQVQRFTTQDFGEYILFLRDGVKTVSIFYLVPNSFRSHATLRACCLQSLSEKLHSLLPDATPEGRNEIYSMHFPVLNKNGFGEAVKDRHNRRFWDDPNKADDAWTGVESRVLVAAASTGAAYVGKHWLGGERTASFNSTQCRCRRRAASSHTACFPHSRQAQLRYKKSRAEGRAEEFCHTS
jgi:hypothetical protein